MTHDQTRASYDAVAAAYAEALSDELGRKPLDRALLTVGEMPGCTVEEARLFTDPARGELDMVFQFEHVQVDEGPAGKWDLRPLDLRALKHSLERWQRGLADVGWNSLSILRRRSESIVDGVADQAQVYFTHSYVAPVTDDSVAVTTHGEPVAAVVQHGQIAGVQFHPAKSGDVGLRILRNFLELAG